jgi:poly-gamma-glutamate synthesis protein (capsule biosynthesis protein)
LDRNGIKIGLLNYTYGTNGIAVPEPTLVNVLDKELILKDIQLARKSKPDVLIAFVHWGLEYKDLPVEDQKNWFNFFKKNGISIVIGSHPHVIEPMEWDKNDQTLVVYSLGNFISNQRFFPSDGGALFELTLKKDDKNQIEISQAEYVLTWVYKKVSAGKTNYYVLPVDEFQYKKHFFLQKKDYDQMMRFTHHVRTLLQKNNLNISEKKIPINYSKFLMREVFIK